MIRIQETKDYRPLITFFIKNELEFEEGEEYEGDEIVKCWRADEYGTSGTPGEPAEFITSGTPGEPAAAPDGSKSPNATATPPPDSRLAGACVLAKRGGEYICDGIAVDPGYRGDELGKTLLDLLIEEAKSRGAGRIFLVARAPGFFAKSGFISVPRNEAPEFFECFTCPQYEKTCHPKVMRLNL
jgi:ribosomal protein S18 acetylase RimI-like enzyme